MRRCVTAIVVGASVACRDINPRAQLVVYVDTDAHVAGELAERQDVFPDATVDTLRVEVLDADDHASDTHTFVVSDRSSWPLSFGVAATSPGAAAVKMRIRAFRGSFASPGTELDAATLDPPPEVTIDRLVEIEFPATAVARVEVTLREDCMGSPATYAPSSATCLDGDHPRASPADGIAALAGPPPPSVVGTWAGAIDVPCAASPSPDSICVPGGFTILGDLAAVGANAALEAAEPVPLRPTLVSPFLLDRLEFTVGRLRALAQSGRLAAEDLPTPSDPTDPTNRDCTWLGADATQNDDLPVNCISDSAAKNACQRVGGQLPTEAQWEHAARGRGQRRDYPWGNVEPLCCSLSVGREDAGCAGNGVEPVGSHPMRADCAGGTGDESRDHVFDLAGSVGEMLSDAPQSYDAPCWTQSAILRDPTCVGAPTVPRAARGTNFTAGIGTAFLALRRSSAPGPTQGFRCAYAGGTP